MIKSIVLVLLALFSLKTNGQQINTLNVCGVIFEIEKSDSLLYIFVEIENKTDKTVLFSKTTSNIHVIGNELIINVGARLTKPTGIPDDFNLQLEIIKPKEKINFKIQLPNYINTDMNCKLNIDFVFQDKLKSKHIDYGKNGKAYIEIKNYLSQAIWIIQ